MANRPRVLNKPQEITLDLPDPSNRECDVCDRRIERRHRILLHSLVREIQECLSSDQSLLDSEDGLPKGQLSIR
jgi:hypothetical protein